MSLRRPPVERERRDNTPDWVRPPLVRGAPTGQPVIPDDLFNRPRKQGDYVREIRINEPFLVANGIDAETVRGLASLDLEALYNGLMTGEGYFSMPSRVTETSYLRGAVMPYLRAGKESIFNDLMNLPPPQRFNMHQLWWEWGYADNLLKVMDASVSTLKAAELFLEKGSNLNFRGTLMQQYAYLRKTVSYPRLRVRDSSANVIRDVTQFAGTLLGGSYFLDDTDLVEVDSSVDGNLRYRVNGQAQAIEIIMTLVAARAGVHVPILCCGLTTDLNQFFVVQADLSGTLDAVLSPDYCSAVAATSLGAVTPDEVERNLLTKAVRSLRIMSRLGMLMLRPSPAQSLFASAWFSGTVNSDVQFTSLPTDTCQLVDLGDEFIQWYMECYLVVALGGPQRNDPASFAQPLAESSVRFLEELLGSSPGRQSFDESVETKSLRGVLRKAWKDERLHIDAGVISAPPLMDNVHTPPESPLEPAGAGPSMPPPTFESSEVYNAELAAALPSGVPLVSGADDSATEVVVMLERLVQAIKEMSPGVPVVVDSRRSLMESIQLGAVNLKKTPAAAAAQLARGNSNPSLVREKRSETEKKYFEDEKVWMNTWDVMNKSVESLRSANVTAHAAYKQAKLDLSTSALETEASYLKKIMDELYEPVGGERKKMTDWLNEKDDSLSELRAAPGAAKATRRALLKEYNDAEPSLVADDDRWKKSYEGITAPEIRLGTLKGLYAEKQQLDGEWAALYNEKQTTLTEVRAKIAEQAVTLEPLEKEATSASTKFRLAEDARDEHKKEKNIPKAPAGTDPSERFLKYTSLNGNSVDKNGTLQASIEMRRKAIAGNSSGEDSSGEDSSGDDVDANFGRMSGIFFRPAALRHGVATNHNGAHFDDGTAVDVSHDSIKFAQYMHLSVMGLAYDFVGYYHPELSGSVPAVVVAAAAGDRYKTTYDALDLLEVMVARTLKHYKDKYASAATTANL